MRASGFDFPRAFPSSRLNVKWPLCEVCIGRNGRKSLKAIELIIGVNYCKKNADLKGSFSVSNHVEKI